MAVLHVDQTTLKRVNDFCQKHGIVRKGWVDAIMLAAVDAGAVDPKKLAFRSTGAAKPSNGDLQKARDTIRRLEARLADEKQKKQPILAPVAQRRVHELPTSAKPAAVEGPPFWKKGNNDGGADEEAADEGREDR